MGIAARVCQVQCLLRRLQTLVQLSDCLSGSVIFSSTSCSHLASVDAQDDDHELIFNMSAYGQTPRRILSLTKATAASLEESLKEALAGEDGKER